MSEITTDTLDTVMIEDRSSYITTETWKTPTEIQSALSEVCDEQTVDLITIQFHFEPLVFTLDTSA